MLKQIAKELTLQLRQIDPFCIVGIGKDRKSLEVHGSFKYEERVPKQFKNLNIVFKYHPVTLE